METELGRRGSQLASERPGAVLGNFYKDDPMAGEYG